MSVKIFDKAQNKWVIFPGSIGAPGRSAYELAVQQGYKGTLDEWLKSIKGADGRDAYTIAVEGGYKGTEEEYNNALTIAPVAVDKINNADTTPTKDSTNLVLSGGVKDAIDSLNSDFNADLATISSSITNLSDEIDNIINVEIGDQLKASIIDNLTSSDTEKALSARQGKVLKELIDNLANLQIAVVDTLPATGESNIIYLIKKVGTGTDIHDEYVYVEGNWEKIGTTDVDLSNYYTKTQVYTKNEVDEKIGSAGGGDVMASGDLANNYIVVGAGTKSIKKSEQLLSDLALKSDIPSLDGYATESWVGTQNFITMPEDLAEDRIVIGAGTNSVTSKRLKTINGVSLLVDDIYNVTNYNVSRMFPWDAFTGSGNITRLYNYLFDGVGQLIPIEYNNSAYTNLPVDGESFVGTLQPYKYTAANNWSVRAFLTSENTGKTYTGVFNMGQSALINWIEIGKDITSSEIVSALGFTPISSNEIPVALPNPYALSITANGTNNSYTGSSVVNINLDSIFSKKLKTVTTPGQPGIFVGTGASGATYEVDTLFVSADEPNAIIVIPSSTSISFDNTIYTEMQDLGTLTGGTYKCYCITYINSSIVLVNGAIYGNS